MKLIINGKNYGNAKKYYASTKKDFVIFQTENARIGIETYKISSYKSVGDKMILSIKGSLKNL